MVEKYDDWDIKLMSPPKRKHSSISANIVSIFKLFFKGKKCRVYHDGRPVHISDEIRNEFKERYEQEFKKEFPKKYLLPDIMIVCDPEIDKDEYVDGAPTLVAEILSKSTMIFDMGLKKEIYKKMGVSEYWLVDPASKLIQMFDFKEDKIDAVYISDEEDEICKEVFSPFSFRDMRIDIYDVFEGI